MENYWRRASEKKRKKERCFLLLLLQLHSGTSNSAKLLLLKTIKAYVLKYNLSNNRTCLQKMGHLTFLKNCKQSHFFKDFLWYVILLRVCHIIKGMSHFEGNVTFFKGLCHYLGYVIITWVCQSFKGTTLFLR